MAEENRDLEQEREDLINLMEENIDSEIMRTIDVANKASLQEEQQLEITISSEGSINA